MRVTKIGEVSNLLEHFLQNLSQSQFASNAECEVCLINFSTLLSNDEHNVIKEMFSKEKAIICLENVKKEHFPNSAALATNAELCIIKSDLGGRRQHIWTLGEEKLPHDGPLPREKVRNRIEINKVEAEGKEQKTEIVAYERETRAILNWLDKIDSLSSSEEQINASLVRGTITFASRNYTSNLNGKDTQCYLSANFDYEIAAVVEPKKNKILKITSVDTSVGIQQLSVDNDDDRGDGTYQGTVIVYPGDKYIYEERASVKLPDGWIRRYYAPDTPNSDNSYSRTTGVSIGGEITPDPKAPAKLTFSYNQSASITESFKDFSAIDNSTPGYQYWRYAYTKVEKNWEDIFTGINKDVEPFPLLAKSTMKMGNEVVYEAPPSEHAWQQFYIIVSHETMYAHSHMSWYLVIYYGIDYKWPMNVWKNYWFNMGLVVFP